MPEGGISDDELLKRLSSTSTEAFVEVVRKELAEARSQGREEWVAEIHARHTYRMHNLSEFMKTLLQRFTRWFNRTHHRKGTLWEERYRSVIVESGVAARTMAAYIDLNPVRAGVVSDPADYRWSSYGEAIGGGAKGNGKKARAGLVRACMSHEGAGFEAEKWMDVSRIYRRAMGLALGRKSGRGVVDSQQRSQPAATLAVAWVMAHPAVTAPIIGARNLEQLESSLAAVDVEMTPEWRAEMSAISPEPPPATDRSEEQKG